MKTVQVLAYGPGYNAEPTFVPPDLATMQAIVGGLVEVFDYEYKGTVYQVLVNEDAEALGLPRNRRVGERLIYGKFVVTKCLDDGSGNLKFKTLPSKEIMKIWEHIDATNARS